MSNALGRLRQQLGDPLVVRKGRGLAPTPRAEELAPLLRDVQARLALALDRRGFVPEESTRTFIIGLADSHQATEVPAIARAFATQLPRAKLRVVSADYLAATDGLASGDVDLAFAPAQAVQPGMRSRVLFEERAAILIRRDHPLVGRRMTREQFNALPHIDVHVVLGRPGTGHRVARRQWEKAQLRRRVVLTVPYFMTAALAAAQTDWVAGVPDRLADLCVRLLPLKKVAAAFPLPQLTTVMVWHERTDVDPGATLFREIVAGAVAVDLRRPKSSIRASRRASRPGPAL